MQEVGLFKNVHDIERTVLKAANGTALKVSDVATVAQGPKIRLGQIGKVCKPDLGTCDYHDPIKVKKPMELKKNRYVARTAS